MEQKQPGADETVVELWSRHRLTIQGRNPQNNFGQSPHPELDFLLKMLFLTGRSPNPFFDFLLEMLHLTGNSSFRRVSVACSATWYKYRPQGSSLSRNFALTTEVISLLWSRTYTHTTHGTLYHKFCPRRGSTLERSLAINLRRDYGSMRMPTGCNENLRPVVFRQHTRLEPTEYRGGKRSA